MEWEEFKKELLKDPEFKKEYEKLEPEYRIIRQILALRRKKNLTQEQLAKLINAKHSSIARIESGKHNPSLRLLEKIAEALGTELDIRFIPKAMGGHTKKLK